MACVTFDMNLFHTGIKYTAPFPLEGTYQLNLNLQSGRAAVFYVYPSTRTRFSEDVVLQALDDLFGSNRK